MDPKTLLPDWTNRRRVIFATLKLCGALGTLMIACICVAFLCDIFSPLAFDIALLNLVGTALYALIFLASSIIGAYVFGANFDYANSRQNVVKLGESLTAANADCNDPDKPPPDR